MTVGMIASPAMAGATKALKRSAVVSFGYSCETYRAVLAESYYVSANDWLQASPQMSCSSAFGRMPPVEPNLLPSAAGPQGDSLTHSTGSALG
jgi:hypothetical protein